MGDQSNVHLLRTEFQTATRELACGRNPDTHHRTSDPRQVTCPSCLAHINPDGPEAQRVRELVAVTSAAAGCFRLASAPGAPPMSMTRTAGGSLVIVATGPMAEAMAAELQQVPHTLQDLPGDVCEADGCTETAAVHTPGGVDLCRHHAEELQGGAGG